MESARMKTLVAVVIAWSIIACSPPAPRVKAKFDAVQYFIDQAETRVYAQP
jgi:hypothetical protein